jgi:hypothetical protein
MDAPAEPKPRPISPLKAPRKRKRIVISCTECHRRKQKVPDLRTLDDAPLLTQPVRPRISMLQLHCSKQTIPLSLRERIRAEATITGGEQQCFIR